MSGKIFVKNQSNNLNAEVLNGSDMDLRCLDGDFIHVWTDGGGNVI